MKISLIAAMDNANAIGLNNQMLWHLPADFAWFKKYTLNKPIIMGRKTYQSIGKALPGRTNIVLSKKGIDLKDAFVVSSLQEALDIAKKAIASKPSVHNQINVKENNVPNVIAMNSEDEIMIIGGATLYQYTLDLAYRLYITEVKHEFKADAYFPKFKETEKITKTDNSPRFELVYQEAYYADEKNSYDMIFKIYDRVKE